MRLDDFALETAEQLKIAATDWVVQVDRGPMGPEEAYDFEQWLATGVRHRGAFARSWAFLGE